MDFKLAFASVSEAFLFIDNFVINKIVKTEFQQRFSQTFH